MKSDHVDLLIQSLENMVEGHPYDGDEPPPPPQQYQPRGHKHYEEVRANTHGASTYTEYTSRRCACIAGGSRCMKNDNPIKMYFIGRRGYYCRGCAVAGSCECKCGTCEDGRFAAQWQGDQRADTSSTRPNRTTEDKQLDQGGKGSGNEELAGLLCHVDP